MRIVARHLCIERGGVRILSDVSFSVSAGSVLVILGRNGAGKSSLLRVLSGENPAARGELSFDGVSVRKWSSTALARRRSFLAQQTECHLPFAAGEIVRLGAEAAGRRGADARRAVAAAMSEAGVEGLAGRSMQSLSGGEQQRVQWARILAQVDGSPQGHCVFLDEPISSLDVAHQHELLSHARQLSRRGAAVIAVLHDINLAARYADRVMILHDAGLYGIGSPATILTPSCLRDVFGVLSHVVAHPVDGTPLVLVMPPGVETRTGSAQTLRQTLC